MFFSWKCAVSGECIKDVHMMEIDDSEEIILVTPEGLVREAFYSGLGKFGSIDAYEWLAVKNNLPEIKQTRRMDGHEAEWDKVEFPIKVVKSKYYSGQKYYELPASEPCFPHGDDIFKD